MKENNISIRNRFIRDEIQRKDGKIDLNFFSANKYQNNNIRTSNIELNKMNIRELSKLSDRPIQQKNDIKKSKYGVYSFDRISKQSKNNMNIKTENNINLNNIYNYNNYNTNIKKNIVIFTDPPKKISDYILKDKSNSKKKVYKLIFIEENDNKRNKKPYRNNYINTETSQNIKNTGFRFNNYKNLKKYNDIYFNNSYNNNNKRKKLYQNKNITKKKYETLTSNIFRIISKKVNIIWKTYAKSFLDKLKINVNNLSRNNWLDKNKKLNKNDRIYVNKNSNKVIIINSYNNYIYQRKNKSPANISFNKKKSNNKQVLNLKTISNKNKNDYDIFNNSNYKNQIQKEISNIIKYIIKKACFIYYPTFLYRLKVLRKLNIVENRYDCLYNLIKIREKTKLYIYFQKYRNIIICETLYNKNNIRNENNICNSNNNYKIRINTRIKYLQNKNTLYISKKRISNLSEIINKIDLKNKKLLLEKYFDRWKKLLSKKIFIPSLKSEFESKNIITKYHSTASPKKKQIKIKKLKSNFNSKVLSKSPRKLNLNSFCSDNVNIKKMKIHKLNVLLDSNQLKNEGMKDVNLILKKNSSDNSYFISKIMNVTNKINNKFFMVKCFKLWKKKST